MFWQLRFEQFLLLRGHRRALQAELDHLDTTSRIMVELLWI